METIISSFALSRLGAIQNPIIHIYRHREVGFCIKQTKAEFVLHPGDWGGFDYGSMVTQVTSDLDTPPTLINGYATADRRPRHPAACAGVPGWRSACPLALLHIGTTSDPKGVLHTDQTLIAAGTGLGKALEVTSDDVGSMAFPYAHIGGPDYIVMMLAFGHPAVLIEVHAGRSGGCLRRTRCHHGGWLDLVLQMFLAEDQKVDGKVMPALRLMAGGGAPKPPEVYYAVKEGMGVPIVHGYGMTECPMICNGSPSDTDDQLANTEGADRGLCGLHRQPRHRRTRRAWRERARCASLDQCCSRATPTHRSKQAPSTSRAASAPAISA